MAPILMCLYFALMYKTLGGYNWSDLFGNNTSNSTNISPISEPIITTPLPDDDFNDEPIESLDKSIFESAKDLQSSFQGLKAVSLVPFIEHCVFLTHNNSEFKFLLFFNFRYSQPMCIEVCSVLQRGGLALYGLLRPHWECFISHISQNTK